MKAAPFDGNNLLDRREVAFVVAEEEYEEVARSMIGGLLDYDWVFLSSCVLGSVCCGVFLCLYSFLWMNRRGGWNENAIEQGRHRVIARVRIVESINHHF